MHFDLTWLKTIKNYGSVWSQSSCKNYYETLFRAGVWLRVARATEIHIHGKKRTFVRLSQVKLDSHRRTIFGAYRIYLDNVPFFPFSLFFPPPLRRLLPPSTALYLLPPNSKYPFHRLASGIEELFFSLSLSLCLLLSLSLPLFLFFFLYALWFARYATDTNDFSLSLDGKRLSSNTFNTTHDDEVEHTNEMRASW